MFAGAPVGRTMLTGALLALAACNGPDTGEDGGARARRESAAAFPQVDRPVAPVVSIRYAREAERDRIGEARVVMDAAGVAPGMTVADLGAGEGYYAVRLARRVGRQGHVVAQDILAEAVDALARRLKREGVTNAVARLGAPDDPHLPQGRFDRVLMVHMYHEIEEPYAFLWNLRPALKPRGEVMVVDAMRPTGQHGTPPRLLVCEFAAVGYRLVALTPLPETGGYAARFRAVGPRPEPAAIPVCPTDADS